MPGGGGPAGYALDTEAALGECRLPAGVSALCTDIGQLIRVLGEAAAAQEACFFTGGGVVPYSAIHGLPPIDREAAHARKQEVLRLLARRQVEEARGALRAWFALFGMVGADDVRWAVDTVNRMVISMEDWYYQFVTPPADGWEPPHSFTACRSRCSAMLEQVLRERRSRHSRPIETALNYIHAHYAQPISMAEVAASSTARRSTFPASSRRRWGRTSAPTSPATGWSGPRSCSRPPICPSPAWRYRRAIPPPDTFPGFTKSTRACPRRRSAGGQNRDKKIKIVTFPAPCGKRYHIRPKNGQAYGSTVFVFFVKLNL